MLKYYYHTEQGCRKLKDYCEEMLGRSGCNSRNVGDECWVVEQDCLKLGKPVTVQEECRPLAKLTEVNKYFFCINTKTYSNTKCSFII